MLTLASVDTSTMHIINFKFFRCGCGEKPVQNNQWFISLMAAKVTDVLSLDECCPHLYPSFLFLSHVRIDFGWGVIFICVISDSNNLFSTYLSSLMEPLTVDVWTPAKPAPLLFFGCFLLLPLKPKTLPPGWHVNKKSCQITFILDCTHW